MADDQPQSEHSMSKRGFLKTVGASLAGGLLTKIPNKVDATLSVVGNLSPEAQVDRGSQILSIIKNEFPDKYTELEAKGKSAQIGALAQSLGSESNDEDEAKIFGRMAGKFLEKNFLNFSEASDTSSITPEMVRVERMLLERYKEKVSVYGFPDVATTANNSYTSQQLYAFQDIFTVLRTYKDQFDNAVNNLPDKGEKLHTINAIDIIGNLTREGREDMPSSDIPTYALIYATMAAEGIGDVQKTGLGIDSLSFWSSYLADFMDFSLSYVDQSHTAIRTGKACASIIKTFPQANSDALYETPISRDIIGISKDTNLPSEASAKGKELASHYAVFSKEKTADLRRNQEEIPAEIRNTNPSFPINFDSIPEVVEARKITNPQERLKKMISLLSVVTSDETDHPRYAFKVEDESIFACNIYSTDLLQAMLGNEVISHRVDRLGKPVQNGGVELHASGMYNWIIDHGAEYGWQDVTRLNFEEKKELLAAGYIFFGATGNHNWVIGMLEGEPILTQASEDIDAMYASPYNYKINGDGSLIHAHRIPH